MQDERKNSEDSPDASDSEDEITQLTRDEEEADRVADLEKQSKDLNDKYLRVYADFENYKKRVAKEKEEIAQFTSEKLLRELVEVKDHLELALSHSQNTETPGNVKVLREGILLTLKQMEKFLEKFGVKEVSALGEPFNPAFHEAIHQEASVEYKPGTVVHVYQKGYLFQDRLLRPARVTVAKDSTPKGDE